MNVNEIIKLIKDTAAIQRGANSVFDGDVYENWNSAEIQYGSVNIGLQNILYNGYKVTYTFVFYYGDRLQQDKGNINGIYSDGVRILQSTINTIESMDDIDVAENILYTPFEQKFMDYLAGVYATVDIECTSELGMCEISDFDDTVEPEPEPEEPIEQTEEENE